MINQEIYILTKHGRFQADYIEKLPVYRRRFFLELFEREKRELDEEYKKLNNKSSGTRKKLR